jgi:molybdopterin/thiamine biosynthesis adenylyltransferase
MYVTRRSRGQEVSVDMDTADTVHRSARILDCEDADDRRVLEQLRAHPGIEFTDRMGEQVSCLQRLRPTPDPELLAEPARWAYYPWRRALVRVLGPRAFRLVRLDRNRNLITSDEQARLGSLRIGVAGLSVGHVIAHTLAAEGLCGQMRLADMDLLELSNLNRVPATVFDLGVNKATVAARRIAELDPYLPVQVLTSGLTTQSIDEFLDGLDIVIEECDSLDMKAAIREAARSRRIPVLMATSDRGLVDVERFDLEPARPILHGLLGELNGGRLSGLTNRDKIPHMLHHLDVPRSSPRAAASMIEVGRTLSTWPQLAGDITLGATAIAEAVRRIGLREDLPSGRIRIDVGGALDHLEDPLTVADDYPPPAQECAAPVEPAEPPADTVDIVGIVAAAAIRAPSGGNSQPWHIETEQGSVNIRLAQQHTSTMDVGFRGSAVAVGAALFNARVAAAAHGVLGPVDVGEWNGQLLEANLHLGHGDDPDLARLYRPMLRRETNRHHGTPEPIAAETIDLLHTAARREGGRLHLITSRSEISTAATIFAASDRIRYLSPQLHAEMVSELRWPGDASRETGIDVLSLELDSGALATLDILRRPEVMAHLAQWAAGTALGDDAHDRVCASSALGVATVQGRRLTDYARGGSAAEAMWILAQQHGLSVQPLSPVFLNAQNDDDLVELSPTFAASLGRLQHDFRDLAGTGPGESQVLVLRFSHAPPTSVRSRRAVHRVLSPAG